MTRPSLNLRTAYRPAVNGWCATCHANDPEASVNGYSHRPVQVVVLIVNTMKLNRPTEEPDSSSASANGIADLEAGREALGQRLARVFLPTAKLMALGLPEPQV